MATAAPPPAASGCPIEVTRGAPTVRCCRFETFNVSAGRSEVEVVISATLAGRPAGIRLRAQLVGLFRYSVLHVNKVLTPLPSQSTNHLQLSTLRPGRTKATAHLVVCVNTQPHSGRCWTGADSRLARGKRNLQVVQEGPERSAKEQLESTRRRRGREGILFLRPSPPFARLPAGVRTHRRSLHRLRRLIVQGFHISRLFLRVVKPVGRARLPPAPVCQPGSDVQTGQ